MKKEVFLAIAIGFALGLVITFGIWTANKSLASIKPGNTTPTPTTADTNIAPTTQPGTTPAPSTETSALTITAPDDELLSSKNTVVVTGKALPNASVVVAYENDEQIVVADAAGLYTATVNLIAGYNVIVVTSFDAQGNEVSQTRTVTYSTAAI